MSDKRRIASAYPEEGEDFFEAILATPWRETLEADVCFAYNAHMKWAAEERANGFSTFPSDDLFWLNVEHLLPGFEQFLSRAARDTPTGHAFMERVEQIYPAAVSVLSLLDIQQ